VNGARGDGVELPWIVGFSYFITNRMDLVFPLLYFATPGLRKKAINNRF
jgi:hypothetical protein